MVKRFQLTNYLIQVIKEKRFKNIKNKINTNREYIFDSDGIKLNEAQVKSVCRKYWDSVTHLPRVK